LGLLDGVLLLFAIVDAPGNLPIFIELTSRMDRATRRKVYDVATLAGLAVVVVFSLVGKFVLDRVFHISVAEFQIAGGLLLIVVGVLSLTGRERHRPAEPGRGLEIAAVPMACPLLVGPGAIVTTMLLVEHGGHALAIGAAVIVFALVRVILWLDEPIRRLLGPLVLAIISRIMHIFIVAIGVHYCLGGLNSALNL